MRTRAKVHIASEQFAAMQHDVETLRNVNSALQAEVERLRSDPKTIEAAARANLNMIRSNEFIVPLE
jgi:cell division protein FtsB